MPYSGYTVDSPLSKVVDHYLTAQSNGQLATETIAVYARTLTAFQDFFGDDDPIPEAIQPHHIDHFLSRFQNIEAKTLLNYYIVLSALWTWMEKREYVTRHVVRQVDPPRYVKKQVVPYTDQELQKLMTATWKMPWAGPMLRAIILTLVGTGLRNAEVCLLKIQDVESDQLFVRRGKGGKQRRVYLPRDARDAVAVYHSLRRSLEPEDYVFLNAFNEPLTRDRLYKLVKKLGEEARVQKPNVHRFRHTYAVGYLKKGGDIRYLQALLGHSTIAVTARYLNITNEDVMVAAKKFNPLDGTG